MLAPSSSQRPPTIEHHRYHTLERHVGVLGRPSKIAPQRTAKAPQRDTNGTRSPTEPRPLPATPSRGHHLAEASAARDDLPIEGTDRRALAAGEPDVERVRTAQLPSDGDRSRCPRGSGADGGDLVWRRRAARPAARRETRPAGERAKNGGTRTGAGPVRKRTTRAREAA